MSRRRFRCLAVLVVATWLPACVSPESTRVRGGGPGADLQNRPAQVMLHEGSVPFWETPVMIDRVYPELAPAQHARQTSVP